MVLAMSTELTTTSEVVKALGGLQKVAELTGRGRTNVVWNWTATTHFPPDTFLVMQAALERQGKSAPASLWRMIEPVSLEGERSAS